MYRRRRGLGTATVLVALVLALALPASALRGFTLRVSINSAGTQANSYSENPVISQDGRFIVFESDAGNLADTDDDGQYDDDTNGVTDVYLHDRDADDDEIYDERQPGEFETIWVSAPPPGHAPQMKKSLSPSLSADGRYVVYSSEATNLVDGDVNAKKDVFLWDRSTMMTTRVSVSALGQIENGDSFDPSISGDGLHVAFTSAATNLLGGDSNLKTDVFVRSYNSDPPTLAGVSLNSSNQFVSGGDSREPAISSDGRRIAFVSDSSNLAPNDDGMHTDVFLRLRDRDGAAGTKGFDDFGNTETRRVSRTPDGTGANDDSSEPAISASGLFVAFTTLADNLLGPTALQVDGNGSADIYRVDLTNLDRPTTVLVSVTTTGEAPHGSSHGSVITADGESVGFWSDADDLASCDGVNDWDVFMRDLAGQYTACESVKSDGSQPNGFSWMPSIDASGRFIVFQSDATDIEAEDPAQQPDPSVIDIFLHDRGVCGTGQLEDGVLSQPIHSLEDDAGPAGPVLHDLNCTYVRPNEPRD